MNHGNEELAPKSPSLWNRLTPKQKQKVKTSLFCFFMLIIVVGTIVYVFYATEKKSREDHQRIQNYVPDIILPSMDFTVYNLILDWAQLLNVSSIASEGDMDSVVLKDIMEDIKERRDMRFGSRLLLPDCRSGRTMNYTCDESMLRFEPGTQRKANAFGNDAPICHYVR
ncbi:unnamed protein product [Arabidopsis lyrata]|uniref:Uncharacterized protein n=1 Tax=Arabidopsis lyrata subsp. lyrata TaxID=81972 RepID=D7KXL8_ARALL|nr:hypothetical protein ARALYDRAFT_894791 [Arabidopsis lyrata subsp. lyrata]CAH8257668.1 unnamed protein product [Arabidopsis lyrata]